MISFPRRLILGTSWASGYRQVFDADARLPLPRLFAGFAQKKGQRKEVHFPFCAKPFPGEVTTNSYSWNRD
jgi:hypothetical protein